MGIDVVFVGTELLIVPLTRTQTAQIYGLQEEDEEEE